MFSCKFFLNFDIVAFSVVFNNYYLTINYLGSKDLFRKLQINCTISFCFRLYLLLHACAIRFDVMRNLIKKNWVNALFRCEKILNFVVVAFSFVCDKYYPIVD